MDFVQGAEKLNVAASLKAHDANYSTFYAGKYLNNYGTPRVGGVQRIPPGWDPARAHEMSYQRWRQKYLLFVETTELEVSRLDTAWDSSLLSNGLSESYCRVLPSLDHNLS